jgi:hypothetical protein
VAGRRTGGYKQLLHDHKEKRGYCKLKEEVLDRTIGRTGFGRDSGPVVRQTQYKRVLVNLVLQRANFARCVNFT